MSDDQIPFDHPELVITREPRCACLLLDTSASMNGQPIAELNAGLVTLKDELMADKMAGQRVEISVISFGPVRVHRDFQSPDTWTSRQYELRLQQNACCAQSSSRPVPNYQGSWTR